jgi:hypothetical protein
LFGLTLGLLTSSQRKNRPGISQDSGPAREDF